MKCIPAVRGCLIPLLLGVALSALSGVHAQETDDLYWTPAGEGFMYLMLMVLFGFNFVVPPARLIYEKYLKGLIEKASERLTDLKTQIMERVNDAQRKMSDRMTAV